MLGIRSAADLEIHPMRGPLFENFIVVEFMKQFLHRGQRPNCYYWRDNTGHEIELLIEHASQMFPMEIKSSQTLKADFSKPLNFSKKYQELQRNNPFWCTRAQKIKTACLEMPEVGTIFLFLNNR